MNSRKPGDFQYEVRIDNETGGADRFPVRTLPEARELAEQFAGDEPTLWKWDGNAYAAAAWDGLECEAAGG